MAALDIALRQISPSKVYSGVFRAMQCTVRTQSNKSIIIRTSVMYIPFMTEDIRGEEMRSMRWTYA